MKSYLSPSSVPPVLAAVGFQRVCSPGPAGTSSPPQPWLQPSLGGRVWKHGGVLGCTTGSISGVLMSWTPPCNSCDNGSRGRTVQPQVPIVPLTYLRNSGSLPLDLLCFSLSDSPPMHSSGISKFTLNYVN